MVHVKTANAAGEGSGGYVVAIKVGTKFLTERADGVVRCPFGTTYEIRLKNKTNKRAVAKVYIDECLVTDQPLILPANGHIDLDCFPQTKKKFKLVSTNSEAAAEAGKNKNTAEMGVIRVEFWPEIQQNYAIPYYYQPAAPIWYLPYTPYCYTGHSVTFSCDANVELTRAATVEGKQSGTTFTMGWCNVDWSQPPIVARLVLRGYVERSSFCDQCGRKRGRESAKFCDQCGVALPPLK